MLEPNDRHTGDGTPKKLNQIQFYTWYSTRVGATFRPGTPPAMTDTLRVAGRRRNGQDLRVGARSRPSKALERSGPGQVGLATGRRLTRGAPTALGRDHECSGCPAAERVHDPRRRPGARARRALGDESPTPMDGADTLARASAADSDLMADAPSTRQRTRRMIWTAPRDPTRASGSAARSRTRRNLGDTTRGVVRLGR